MEEISQYVYGPRAVGIELSVLSPAVHLDAANEVEAILSRELGCLIVAREGVVIRNSQCFQAICESSLDELGGAVCAIGFVGVGVKIDQCLTQNRGSSPDSKSNVSPAAWRSRCPVPKGFPALSKNTAPSVVWPGASFTGTRQIADAAAAAFSLADETSASAFWRRIS